MPTSENLRGFTLLEMLVVLLIAGMALLLTTQALGQYQRAHTRAIASERTGREQRSSERWFRDAVRGLQAISPRPDDAAPGFEGDAGGFTGVTLEPVFAGQGIPTPQRWRIVDGHGRGDRLELEEGNRHLLLALPPARSLRFHYLDPQGAVHDRWPPAQGAWSQLPEAILLELSPPAEDPGQATIVASAVLGPKDSVDAPFEDAVE